MSLDTIHITRQIPIINGYVQLPNNNPVDKTSVPVAGFVALSGGVVNRLSQASGMGRNGGKFGIQEWVEFSENLCCPTDWAIEDTKTAYGTNDRTDSKMPWAA
jgi:hypothetical protein